jgi:hypothetical protein
MENQKDRSMDRAARMVQQSEYLRLNGDVPLAVEKGDVGAAWLQG